MTAEALTGRTCDLCGAPMVRAVAKTGSRAGKPLWRCSDFACPGIVNIDGHSATAVEQLDAALTPPQPGESAQAEFERLRLDRTQRLRRAAPFLTALGVLLSV